MRRPWPFGHAHAHTWRAVTQPHAPHMYGIFRQLPVQALGGQQASHRRAQPQAPPGAKACPLRRRPFVCVASYGCPLYALCVHACMQAEDSRARQFRFRSKQSELNWAALYTVDLDRLMQVRRARAPACMHAQAARRAPASAHMQSAASHAHRCDLGRLRASKRACCQDPLPESLRSYHAPLI